MVFNTASVGMAVTPAVISTFVSHYTNRKVRAKKPTAHISYDEGLALIGKFLLYASHNTVEDLQRFTSQWVPHPRWVRVEEVNIPAEQIAKAVEVIQAQLGPKGIEQVGGKTWWQWRRPGSELKAEWIEMRSDYNVRKKDGGRGKRVMLYVHGGAYFFGSVDEHRYQMQRHARKLKARVFAPRYRLAPQFPFPCGLLDCLAAYMYLLTIHDPTEIILAGDSAGGGMVISMMVILRDQGLPLPAGAVLISPWVDLTHSFPSVAGDNPMDYIPPHGFHQKPSPSWPPPNSDDMLQIANNQVHPSSRPATAQTEGEAVQGFQVQSAGPGAQNADASMSGAATAEGTGKNANPIAGPGHNLSIMIDGKKVEIKDQIQMYATNQLMSHPLVSPVLQPSLGGLPPLLILTGGGEMLRDEQIYLAHKAAHPSQYPPGDAFLDEYPEAREQIKKYKPTDVQLQVWDDLCHVAPTLSFTRPAKYMYRSISQFGAWALARAQKTEIEIVDDDEISQISTESSSGASAEKKASGPTQVGKAGDPLPPFHNHMIRQRVSRSGEIYALVPPHELPGCTMSPAEIGVIKPGPVRKWMAAKRQWDTKYASEKRRVQKQRMKEMETCYEPFGDGEQPPPSALAGRIKTAKIEHEKKRSKSMGLSLWALWGSSHDKESNEREVEADRNPKTADTVATTSYDGSEGGDLHVPMATKRGSVGKKGDVEGRSRSRRRIVSDERQTEHQHDAMPIDENATIADHLAARGESDNIPSFLLSKDAKTGPAAALGANNTVDDEPLEPPAPRPEPARASSGTLGNQTDFSLKRPKAQGVAFPFTIKKNKALAPDNASMVTITSDKGVPPVEDVRTLGAVKDGLPKSSPLNPNSGAGFKANPAGKTSANAAAAAAAAIHNDENGNGAETSSKTAPAAVAAARVASKGINGLTPNPNVRSNSPLGMNKHQVSGGATTAAGTAMGSSARRVSPVGPATNGPALRDLEGEGDAEDLPMPPARPGQVTPDQRSVRSYTAW